MTSEDTLDGPVGAGDDTDFVETPTIDDEPSPHDAPAESTGPGPATTGPVVGTPHEHKPMGILTLAAIGVVFGDIGTSPLYSLQTVFTEHGRIIKPTEDNVFGIISMVVWAITLIVLVKYVLIALRADNEGEGGILSLVALLKGKLKGRRKLMAAALIGGMLGASLFYGDSVITPAISVMSAIEGLSVASPGLEHWVLPLSVIILTALFIVQRWGTARVGKLFGPIMVFWFLSLAALGVPHILKNPRILGAFSPHHAIAFAVAHPFLAFVAMGAVVLTITGAEALYADMGHFGARPIRLAFLGLIFPSLLVNYMGQGAMLLQDPAKADNPFFRLAPAGLTYPLVVLATIATVIASQAVISGAFSVSRQATRLGLLPRLTIKHTSKSEGGQIYIGSINWLLFVGVLLLISIFQSSTRLASAYGLAVTSTLMLETCMFMILMRYVWRLSLPMVALFGIIIGGLEALILSANFLKIISGGWIPLLIAAAVVTIMLIWKKGTELLKYRRDLVEGDFDAFLDKVHIDPKIRRIPGIAVFPHSSKDTTPLALKGNVQFNHVVHETVIVVNIVNEPVPHVRHIDRETLDDLGTTTDGIFYVECRVGFNDSQDVPKAIRLAFKTFEEFKGLDEADVMYFLSHGEVKRNPEETRKTRTMSRWRRRLFVALYKNQADRNIIYHTPKDRTVVLGAELFL